MSKGKYFKLFVCIILVLELAYSFTQHYQEPIDGDVANIVYGYKEVLNDPFGLTVIFEDSHHGNPNRFFVHYFMSGYVKNMPLFLQKIFEPIDSIYVAFAFFKCCLQILLIFILSAYISGTRKIGDRDFLIATLLVFPLLQMTQFNKFMGIIMSSVTYTFFYTLPLLLLILLLFPLYKHRAINYSNRIGPVKIVFFIIALIVLAFSGPLMPPLIVIIAGSILIHDFLKKQQRGTVLSKIGLLCILSILVALYSFYIGSHNTENTEITIGHRYELFFTGLYNQLTRKLCYPILLGVILANLFLIRSNKNSEAKELLQIASILLVLGIGYLMLLPFGGFRDYRPDIVRADTFLPITLVLVYLFGITTLHLLKKNSPPKMKYYKWLIVGCLLYFVIADEPNWGKNLCERAALQQLSETTNDSLLLDNDCNILSWNKMEQHGQSLNNSKLLQHWNVTKKPVIYINNK